MAINRIGNKIDEYVEGLLGIRQAVKTHNYLLVWSYAIVLAFCITEQWMMELSFNMMPLVAIVSLHEKYSEKDQQRNQYIEACLPYILQIKSTFTGK